MKLEDHRQENIEILNSILHQIPMSKQVDGTLNSDVYEMLYEIVDDFDYDPKLLMSELFERR